MKKLLCLFIFVLMASFLTACFSSNNVVKFTFTMNESSGKTVLGLNPDYAKRTLSVDYKKDKLDLKQQSVASTGQIGGEYFDRFEKMVKVVKEYKAEDGKTLDVQKSSLLAVVENKDKGVVSIQVAADDSNKDIQALLKFYSEVVNLLTETPPV